MIFLLFMGESCIPSAQRKLESKIYESTRYSTYLTFYLMKDFIEEGNYTSAIEVYDNFNGLKNNHIEFLYAYSLMKTGSYQKAAEVFEELWNKRFLPDYSLYFSGLNHFKNGEFEKSKKLLELHLSLFPTSIFTQEDRCILTKITLKLGVDKNYEGDFPDSADCLFTLIQKERKQGRNILPLVKRFIMKYPAHPYESDLLSLAGTNIFKLLNTGQLKQRWNYLLSRGKFDIVKREARAFGRRSGDYGCYYYYSGMIRFKKKDYFTAIRYFKKARRTRHNRCAEETIYNLGRSYARINNNEKSLEAFKILLKKFPNTHLREEAIYRIALVYSYMKDTDSTIRAFQRYLKEFPDGKYTSEAHWEIADSSYSRGNTEMTFSHLLSMVESGNYMERARGLYWLSKWFRREDFAQTLFREYPLNYYTYIASRCSRISPPPWDARIRFYASQITYFPPPSTMVTTHMYNLKELANLGLPGYIYSETKQILSLSSHPRLDAYMLGNWLNENHYYHYAVRIVVNNFPDSMLLPRRDQPVYIDLTRLIFPPAYKEIVKQWADTFNIAPQWIWAVMRQESRFNPRIVSVAGARGLLQVIDPTARKMLKLMGESPANYDLFNPDDNIKIGSYYLKLLFQKFDDDPIPVLASYNAGEDNVVRWLNTGHYNCMDRFVEDIPFQETRKYVKKVISNWMVYEFLKRLPEYEAHKNF